MSPLGRYLASVRKKPFFLLALLFWWMRALIFLQVIGTPLSYLHLWEESDMAYFVQVAKAIAGGDLFMVNPPHPYYSWMKASGTAEEWEKWFGSKHGFLLEPFYPYLLSALFALVGVHPSLWILFNQCLSFITLLLLYHLTLRIIGQGAALFAGLIYTCYGPLMMYETVPLREVLLVFLVFAVVYLSLIQRYPFLLGIIAGAAFLTKSVTLLIFPFALFVLIKGRKPIVETIGLVFAGFVVMLFPFSLRNLWLGEPPFSFSLRGPIAVFSGNDASVRGVLADTQNIEKKGERFRTLVMHHGYAFLPIAWATIRSHGSVGGYLGFLAKKIYYQFHAYEAWNNVNYHFYRMLLFPMDKALPFLPLFLMGLFGFVFLFRSHPKACLMVLGVWVIVLAHALIANVLARYRQVLIPAWAFSASFAYDQIIPWFRQKAWLPLGVFVMVFSIGWVVLSIGNPGPKIRPADFGVYEMILAKHPELTVNARYSGVKRYCLTDDLLP